MTTDLSLNGVSLAAAVPAAAVLEVRRRLVGAPRFQRVAIPGRAGSYEFAEEPGDRLLTAVVHIQSSTIAARRTAVGALADWCDLNLSTKLIVDDQTDRYYDAILSNAPDTLEWLNAATIDLEFLTGPYALATSTSSESVTAASSGATGSWIAPDAVNAEPVVELQAVGGTVTGFTFTLNGDPLTWAAGTVLAAGETITASSICDTVTQGANEDVNLTGTFDSAAVDMANVTGTFGLVQPGTNTWSLTWTGTATSVYITITWRRRYR